MLYTGIYSKQNEIPVMKDLKIYLINRCCETNDSKYSMHAIDAGKISLKMFYVKFRYF